MSGIVLIPCWRRPDFLAATLHRIQLARACRAQRYVFAIDRDPNPAIFDVIKAFGLPHTIRQVMHAWSGPAYNILRGYQAALAVEPSPAWVGLIEEDVLVAEDIFEFWDAAFALDAQAFAVSACRNQNQPPMLFADRDAPRVYVDHSYQAIGTAHRATAAFREVVTHHANPRYFARPIAYCAEHLPDEGLPAGAASQDGLFHRVVRRDRLRVLYPIVPRAFHAGWTGWNRPQGTALQGAWADRAAQILMLTGDQMNALADPRFRDLAPCKLIRPPTALTLD
jgi:hypothetical protein